MKFRANVTVLPHTELLDPQGKAVLGGLHNMQLSNIEDVRVGKQIQLTIESNDAEAAKQIATEAAQKLLANPVMEMFEVEVEQIG